jgi:hypothetical protein
MRYIVDYQNYGSGGRGGYHWGNGEMYISPNNRMDDGSHVFTIHEALHAIRQPEGGGGRWEEANCYYISELLFYFLTGRMMYGSLARAYNAPWDAEKIVYDNPNADPPIFVPFTYEHHLNRLANIGDSPADAKAFVDRLPDRLKRPINPNNITQTLPDIVTLVAPRLEQDIGRRLAAHPDTGDLEFAPIK